MLKRIAALLAAGSVLLAGCVSGRNVRTGTYTASIDGMNGPVAVSVEISGNKITSVTVTDNLETTGIGSPLRDADGNVLTAGGLSPADAIPRRIVEAQSVNVDVVTGATITSRAIMAAVNECLRQAGATLGDWNAKPRAAAAPRNASADVVIVGGGGAGLAAAIVAGQAGKSVIVVEKAGEVGGDTLVCGGSYNSPAEALQRQVVMTEPVKRTIEAALNERPVSAEHAALQAEVRAQWNAYNASGRTDLFDSKEWYALQTWNGGDKVADLNLVKELADNAYDGLEWIKGLGMGFNNVILQAAGGLWQRTHESTMLMGTGFISTYVSNLAKMGNVTIMVETTGKSFVTSGGRVTGVVCADRNGNEFTVAANDGVILATGGFGANSQMVQRYNTTGKWPDLSQSGTTNRFSSSQGDGIAMATDVGAGLRDMEQIQLLFLGNTKDGQLTKWPPRAARELDQMIFINKEGRRFVNEGGRRDDICLAILAQTDRMYYMLESADGTGYKDIHDPSWRSADGFTFDYLTDNGYMIWDDTLAGLAGKLGMDAATLQATVDAFNRSVTTGVDNEFGRTIYSVRLTNGPWVATPRQACIHHTMGGVTIDTSTRVLDANGDVIPGLYAAGEVVGGIHGGNRVGGNAITDIVVFGKLAGETLVADAR